MTDSRRFAVPLEQLEGVHVDEALQVQEQAAPVHPAAAGSLVHPFGDGMADADGD